MSKEIKKGKSVEVEKASGKKMGRPTKYTPELMDRIFEKIACSSLGLEDILSSDPDFPGSTAFYSWVDKYPEIADKYAHARARQAEYMASEIIRIADDSSNDTAYTDDGRAIENKEWVNRSRLRIDTRKWLMSKLLPKKYGDKLDVTSDGGALFSISLNITQDQADRIKKLQGE